MARIESFTVGTYVVGGAAPTDTTQITGRFGWEYDSFTSEETATFVSDFILTGSSYADLNTRSKAMLDTLRGKYQKLTVDWGASNVATYDPTVANSTGFDIDTDTTKARDVMSTGFTRGFTFRARVQLPPNYTDPNLPGTPNANGRRTSTVNMRWDVNKRRVVTITGVFTQIPGKLPRALTTTSQTNHPDTTKEIDTYCSQRLTKIDAAAAWTITSRDEQDSNSQSILNFRREYTETLNGRVGSRLSISYAPSRQRVITITGTYVRTYGTGTATTGAKANYLDNTNGGYANAVIQLAAMIASEGGPLVPGNSCELISESYPPNEQDDRVDYTLVFRELLFQQSKAVSSGLDDPDIALDSITYAIEYTPLDDSPFPPPVGAAQDPSPFRPAPGAGGNAGGGKPAGTQMPVTLERPAVPATVPGTQDRGNQPAGTTIQKPVDIWIYYKATIKATVTDLQKKWTSDIRPWLVGQWTAELGFGPTYFIQDRFEEDAASNTLGAVIHARALPGDVFSYRLEESVTDDLGIALDQAFTGTPYEYLVQQLCPERKKFRKHTVFYKTGSSFDPSSLCTTTAVPGYIVVSRSAPMIATAITGIASSGTTQSITGVQFVEALVYVARAVDGSSAPGGSPPSGAPDGGNPTTVSPQNRGGV